MSLYVLLLLSTIFLNVELICGRPTWLFLACLVLYPYICWFVLKYSGFLSKNADFKIRPDVSVLPHLLQSVAVCQILGVVHKKRSPNLTMGLSLPVFFWFKCNLQDLSYTISWIPTYALPNIVLATNPMPKIILKQPYFTFSYSLVNHLRYVKKEQDKAQVRALR